LGTTESKPFINSVDFSQVYRFQLTGSVHLNPHASLKLSDTNFEGVSANQLVENPSFPTVQLINCGQGGSRDGLYQTNNICVDSLLVQSLVNSDLEPENIYFPQRYQFGVKMGWLDEFNYEGNDQISYRFHPYHGYQRGAGIVNQSIVAHSSVRPQVVTRAPHQNSAYKYTHYHAGNWMASLASPEPGSVDAIGLVSSDGNYTQNPFGSVLQHGEGYAVMFELPDHRYGSISLGSLQHANVSPFSWHPSYIIGNSLADLSAPADASANFLLENVSTAKSSIGLANYFDYYLGASAKISDDDMTKRWWDSSIRWGSSTSSNMAQSFGGLTNSETLIQIGNDRVTKVLNGSEINSEEEILLYDSSFEVNQNLFDSYFFSGMPIIESNSLAQKGFEWKIGGPLYADHLKFNSHASISSDLVDTKLSENSGDTGEPKGLAYGFWNNGYLLSHKAQFNVNSTSVDAWIAMLSGNRGELRLDTKGRVIGDANEQIYSRVKNPLGVGKAGQLDASRDEVFYGGRILTDRNIRNLAENIVLQVKQRGPFLSLADFVNRRLSTPANRTFLAQFGDESNLVKLATFDNNDDPHSRMGALEAAIQASGLNDEIESHSAIASEFGLVSGSPTYEPVGVENNPRQFAEKTIDPPSEASSPHGIQPIEDGDDSPVRGHATHEEWQPNYKRQAKTRIWGVPSYLTQADILTPIAPHLAVRGETFTVRVCGQSWSKGILQAEAYLEASVIRIPEYVDKEKNMATTPAVYIDQLSARITHNSLSKRNKMLGRKFKVISLKWLGVNEI